MAATVTARQYGVSGQTIRNRLRRNAQPIRARRPYTCRIMTQRQRAARLLWARRYLNWRRADWNRVLFTDESRFTVSMLTEDYGYTGVKMKDSPNVALLRRTGLGEGA